jgi:hypothetical protein
MAAIPCPLRPGQAVAYLPPRNDAPRKNPRRLIFGIVTGVNPATSRVTLIEPSDQRRTVGAWNVAPQGFCPACQAPAVLSENGLICPSCHHPAPLPPPDHWLRSAFGPFHDQYPRLIARMVAGATEAEAWEGMKADEQERARAARAAAEQATGREHVYLPGVPEAVRQELRDLADAGRVEEYADLYQLVADAPATVSAVLALRRVEQGEGAEACRALCLAWLERLGEQAGDLPAPALMPFDDRTPDAARTPAPKWLRGLGL